MKWLIWKELRLQRLVLVVAVVSLLLPSLCLLVAYWRGGDAYADNRVAVVLTIVFADISLALLGGNAIACERADRSAEFLRYLPVSRRQIVVSKLFVPLVVIGLICTVIPILATTDHLGMLLDWQEMTFLGLFGVVAFSVAWLISAVQDSPTFAVGAGLFAPLAVGVLTAGTVQVFELFAPGIVLDPNVLWNYSFATLSISLAIASFVGGTWYYLHQVEP